MPVDAPEIEAVRVNVSEVIVEGGSIIDTETAKTDLTNGEKNEKTKNPKIKLTEK